jgi:hypothetical protein
VTAELFTSSGTRSEALRLPVLHAVGVERVVRRARPSRARRRHRTRRRDRPHRLGPGRRHDGSRRSDGGLRGPLARCGEGGGRSRRSCVLGAGTRRGRDLLRSARGGRRRGCDRWLRGGRRRRDMARAGRVRTERDDETGAREQGHERCPDAPPSRPRLRGGGQSRLLRRARHRAGRRRGAKRCGCGRSDGCDVLGRRGLGLSKRYARRGEARARQDPDARVGGWPGGSTRLPHRRSSSKRVADGVEPRRLRGPLFFDPAREHRGGRHRAERRHRRCAQRVAHLTRRRPAIGLGERQRACDDRGDARVDVGEEARE